MARCAGSCSPLSCSWCCYPPQTRAPRHRPTTTRLPRRSSPGPTSRSAAPTWTPPRRAASPGTTTSSARRRPRPTRSPPSGTAGPRRSRASTRSTPAARRSTSRLALYTEGVPLTTLSRNNFDVCDRAERVGRLLQSGQQLLIAVDGVLGDTGTFTLDISVPAPPDNDAFATPRTLTGATDTDTVPVGGATAEAGEPAHAGTAAFASAWWTWQAPSTGNFVIDSVPARRRGRRPTDAGRSRSTRRAARASPGWRRSPRTGSRCSAGAALRACRRRDGQRHRRPGLRHRRRRAVGGEEPAVARQRPARHAAGQRPVRRRDAADRPERLRLGRHARRDRRAALEPRHNISSAAYHSAWWKVTVPTDGDYQLDASADYPRRSTSSRQTGTGFAGLLQFRRGSFVQQLDEQSGRCATSGSAPPAPARRADLLPGDRRGRRRQLRQPSARRPCRRRAVAARRAGQRRLRRRRAARPAKPTRQRRTRSARRSRPASRRRSTTTAPDRTVWFTWVAPADRRVRRSTSATPTRTSGPSPAGSPTSTVFAQTAAGSPGCRSVPEEIGECDGESGLSSDVLVFAATQGTTYAIPRRRPAQRRLHPVRHPPALR